MRMFRIVVLVLVLFAVLGTACISLSRSDRPPIAIDVDRQEFSPLMSSTVGIGLTPVLPSSLDNDSVECRWLTDYGTFLSWGPPDFKVYDLGSDPVANYKIYWSYNASDMGKEKPPVQVLLSVWDKKTGRVINTTGIGISWKDNDTAVVEK